MTISNALFGSAFIRTAIGVDQRMRSATDEATALTIPAVIGVMAMDF